LIFLFSIKLASSIILNTMKQPYIIAIPPFLIIQKIWCVSTRFAWLLIASKKHAF
jgi:hypothetical protein